MTRKDTGVRHGESPRFRHAVTVNDDGCRAHASVEVAGASGSGARSAIRLQVSVRAGRGGARSDAACARNPRPPSGKEPAEPR